MRKWTAITVISLIIALLVVACAYEFRYKKTVTTEMTRTKKMPKDTTKVKKP
jgi:uncharacterized phage infection (PIP) family protein YhgE